MNFELISPAADKMDDFDFVRVVYQNAFPIFFAHDLSVKGEFTGTLYFEFVPGGYTGNHWQDNAVYLSDEVFELIEPVFVKVIPSFGHYSPNEISRSNWELIINELQGLKATLVKASTTADIRENMRLYGKFEALFFRRFR